MLTATSPVLLNDDKPYNVPLALGLLFSEVFVLFLVGGFLVVVFVGLGLGFGLVALVGGFVSGLVGGFVGGLVSGFVGVLVGGFVGGLVGGLVLIVVGLAFSEPVFSLIALASSAAGVCSVITSFGFTSFVWIISSLTVSGTSATVALLTRAAFFFLFKFFLKVKLNYVRILCVSGFEWVSLFVCHLNKTLGKAPYTFSSGSLVSKIIFIGTFSFLNIIYEIPSPWYKLIQIFYLFDLVLLLFFGLELFLLASIGCSLTLTGSYDVLRISFIFSKMLSTKRLYLTI